jgi:hypothetical protein
MGVMRPWLTPVRNAHRCSLDPRPLPAPKLNRFLRPKANFLSPTTLVCPYGPKGEGWFVPLTQIRGQGYKGYCARICDTGSYEFASLRQARRGFLPLSTAAPFPRSTADAFGVPRSGLR